MEQQAETTRLSAWDKLGVDVRAANTAKEAQELSGLTYAVELHPAYAYVERNGGKDALLVPDKYATVKVDRDGGMTPISIVGSRYSIVQIEPAFQILDDIAGESGAHYRSAGFYNEGANVFMAMGLPDCIEYDDNERIDLSLICQNSFDGSTSLRFWIGTLRLACTNALELSWRKASSFFSIRHTNSAVGRMQRARDVLGLTLKYKDALQEDIDRMLDKVYTDVMFENLVNKLVVLPDDPSNIQKERAEASRTALHGLWTAPTQEDITGTAWGAYNAVVEWADWHSPVRGKDEATSRALRTFNGTTRRIKERAYQLITG